MEGDLLCETHARQKAQAPGPDMEPIAVYKYVDHFQLAPYGR